MTVPVNNWRSLSCFFRCRRRNWDEVAKRLLGPALSWDRVTVFITWFVLKKFKIIFFERLRRNRWNASISINWISDGLKFGPRNGKRARTETEAFGSVGSGPDGTSLTCEVHSSKDIVSEYYMCTCKVYWQSWQRFGPNRSCACNISASFQIRLMNRTSKGAIQTKQ